MAMVLNDYGKLLLLLAILAAVVLLAALGVLEAGDVRTVLAVELGYITGNGVLAKRQQAPSPVLVAATAPAADPEGT